MYDLAIVGGGLSGTLTLIYLIEEICGDSRLQRTGCPPHLNIAWLDENDDFGRGVAYGEAAHAKFLLNNDVSCMNVGRFHLWLRENQSRWLPELEAHSDPVVQKWLSRHLAQLQAAEERSDLYLPMFLPRYVFGMFVSDWLASSLEKASQAGIAVARIAEKATSAARQQGGIQIATKRGRELLTHSVVLALGSLPPDPAPSLQHLDGYLHEWRMPDGGESLRQMSRAKSRAKGGPCRLLMIGSNAAAIEALYVIANDEACSRYVGEIAVVSPSGRLPDACGPSPSEFQPEHLPRLLWAAEISASELIAAALADAALGQQRGFRPAECGKAIVRSFGEIFPRLPAPEKRKFVEEFGMQLTALNRHTPPDYADAKTALENSGRLTTVAAQVIDTRYAKNQFEIVIRRIGRIENSEPETLQAGIVINCRGSGRLAQSDEPFLNSLFANGIATINRSGLGIAVSSDFEASSGVFVVGPLLAGHSEGSFHLWNLERAERIDALAKNVVPALTSRLLTPREPIASAN